MILTHHGINSLRRSAGPEYGTITIGGHEYRTVIIGNQEWIAENLQYEWNGLRICDSSNPMDQDTSVAQGVYPNYDQSDKETYGVLYNFTAAKYINDNVDSIGISGWRVATAYDYDVMLNYLGDGNGTKLRSSEYWNGTNASGFDLRPSGFYYPDQDVFATGYNLTWTSTDGETGTTRGLTVSDDTETVIQVDASIPTYFGLPIRLVRDLPVDIDGHSYRTVVMPDGNIWMAENMADSGSGVWYDDDQSTYEALGYGKLYTWDEAMALSNATSGWHLPTKDECDNLLRCCGGTSVAGGKLKYRSGWNGGGNGTDDYWFSAKPAGYKYGNNYSNLGFKCDLWTQTEVSPGRSAYYLAFGTNNTASTPSKYETYANSVRLVKDYSTVTVGNRVYKTAVIGNQEWMGENLDFRFTELNFRDSLSNPLDTTTSIQAAYCNYDATTYGANGNKYGLLYNWYAVDYINNHLSDLGIVDGWHAPTDDEWNTLLNYLGGFQVAGGRLKSMLWPNSGATDIFGFGALPAPYWYNGDFVDLNSTRFWTATVNTEQSGHAIYKHMEGDTHVRTYSFPFHAAFSVRLVRNLT